MRPEGPWPIALRHAYAALHFKVSRPLTPAAALHYQFVSLRLVLVVARGTSSYIDVLLASMVCQQRLSFLGMWNYAFTPHIAVLRILI